MREIDLRRYSELVTILGFILVIITTALSFYQLHELRISISTQNMATLSGRLADPLNTEIFETIDSNKPVRKINTGQFSDYQLDNYIGLFQLLSRIKGDGFISSDDYCDQFSYYIEKTYDNKEIQSYLSEIRKEDSNFFLGFDDLAKEVGHECNSVI